MSRSLPKKQRHHYTHVYSPVERALLYAAHTFAIASVIPRYISSRSWSDSLAA